MIKRAVDFIFSLVGLVLLSPLFLIIALLIKLDSPGPVFSRQEMTGRGFRSFALYAFRTLRKGALSARLPLSPSNDPRLTRVGRMLRQARLDTLPQLYNVLKGDMSLVGPQAEPKQYVHLYRDRYEKILALRPGLANLASIKYRNELEMLENAADPEKEYVNNILPDKIRLAEESISRSSLLFDVKLVLAVLFQLDPGEPPRSRGGKVALSGLAFFLIDTLLSFASFYIAFFMRYDWQVTEAQIGVFLGLLPFIFLSRTSAYFFFGFYSRLWEYASLEDLILIIKAVAVGSCLMLFSIFISSNPPVSLPRSVPIIDFVLLITLLGGSRLAWRLWNQRKKKMSMIEGQGIKVLILGASDTGAGLLKNIRTKSLNFSVCGFVDDDHNLLDTSLMGVKVLGDRYSIPRLANKLGVKEVWIAAPQMTADSLGEIVNICNSAQVKYKLASTVTDAVTKEVHVSKVRKIEVSDLLGRESVSLDLSSIKEMVRGKRVLVTGAGGSIGSELSQQILEYQPSALIMLDRGENYLYELSVSLKPDAGVTQMHYVFGSITNKEKMDSVFSKYRPNLVFHAAAHKHVPLMESNVDEAVINNIYGTKVIADASDRYGVERFVMISTDKVVRPTSIMGTTKKVAEKYIQYINQISATKFMTVRFGNVLGSKGSVILLFQSQIENGGPVTVTHPQMTRFFMLIPEAVQLILQAAVMGHGGEIFILEMGEPVKIDLLARKMIRLAGYEPEKDIKVEYTGVRPGEKLFEELVDDSNEVVDTQHDKIRILNTRSEVEGEFNRRIEDLFRVAVTGDFMKIRVLMSRLIGEEFTSEIISRKGLKETSLEL
jgi:FlaA1/EpsC-like NDP-sugar epimerase/lipopolysaccharide/colanic/teichoic acid biosynthesis glycosyltransferase